MLNALAYIAGEIAAGIGEGNMAKKATKVSSVDVTEDLIEEWFKLDGLRRAASRKAEELKKRLKPFIDQFTAHVKKHGGKTKTVKLGQFRLLLEKVDGTPSWKDAFIDLAGQEAADKLRANTPGRDSLKIERIK